MPKCIRCSESFTRGAEDTTTIPFGTRYCAVLEDLLTNPGYGKTLRDAEVDISSPDDRSTPPFETAVELYEVTFSDGSIAYNARIAMTEAN